MSSHELSAEFAVGFLTEFGNLVWILLHFGSALSEACVKSWTAVPHCDHLDKAELPSLIIGSQATLTPYQAREAGTNCCMVLTQNCNRLNVEQGAVCKQQAELGRCTMAPEDLSKSQVWRASLGDVGGAIHGCGIAEVVELEHCRPARES